MRGRRGSAALSAAGILAGAVACGSGNAAAFHPAGSMSPVPVQAALPAAGEHRGGYRFPRDVSIDFTAPPPASAVQRAVLAGYQDYVLSLWAAVLTHGKNTTYLRHAGGTAASYVRHEAARYASAAVTLKGTISYTGIKIAGVYFGTGANVLSCVDASALHRVNARTGAAEGPALPVRLTRYLENVAEGRNSDGTWSVTRLASYPATSTTGAMCR